jgi:hypothetical protein
MAKSTAENPISFQGNNKSTVVFWNDDWDTLKIYDLSNQTEALSLPVD